MPEHSKENCDEHRRSLTIRKFMYIDKSTEEAASRFCDFILPKNIEYIIGPINYTEYTIGDVSIGIFGEIHSFKVKDCSSKIPQQKSILFHNFLDMVLRSNQSRLYDFYFEERFIDKKISKERFGVYDRGMFGYIEGLLESCLLFDKRSCDYPNLRAHYVDIRDVTGLENFAKLYTETTTTPIVRHELILKCIADVQRILTENKLVAKEIRKSYHGDKIHEFALTEFEKIKHDLQDRIKRNENIYLGRVAMLYVLIMDVYALARMFRYFDGQPVKNIVVYVGDAHADNYRKFINEYLLQTPTIKIGKSWTSMDDVAGCLYVGPELQQQKSILFDSLFGQKI